MKIIKFGVVIGAIGLLSGCALTQDKVPFNSQIMPARHIIKAAHPVVISVSTKDLRKNNDNPRLLFHKHNLYGVVAPGSYVANQPVAMLLKKIVSRAVQQMGYSVANRSKLIVKCNLMNIHPDAEQHFWYGQMNVAVNLSVSVFNKHSHQKVWHKIIVGRASTRIYGLSMRKVGVVVSQAMKNAVHQLQVSHSFSAALQS